MVGMNLDFYKDYVQRVYPNAHCFMMNYSYCVMDIPPQMMEQVMRNEVFATWPQFYSRWQDSSELAWRDAYERIQIETLAKFGG